MAQSVIVTFADTAMIERGTEAIKKLHAEGSIKLYAAAVVARDLSGKLSIKEIADEGHGVTAATLDRRISWFASRSASDDGRRCCWRVNRYVG